MLKIKVTFKRLVGRNVSDALKPRRQRQTASHRSSEGYVSSSVKLQTPEKMLKFGFFTADRRRSGCSTLSGHENDLSISIKDVMKQV